MNVNKAWICLCGGAILVLVGCASPEARGKRNPFQPIWHAYETQAYDDCLRRIKGEMNRNLTEAQRATLLSVEALCQEEMGDESLANETYKRITVEFPLTSFAEKANRRLKKQDADQLEHFELAMNDLKWRRAGKQWNDRGVRTLHTPMGETPTNCAVKLLLMSILPPLGVKSLDEVMARAEADTKLKRGQVSITPLERTANEGYWKSFEWHEERKLSAVLLTRVILREKRLHVAEFTIYKPTITKEEEEKYLTWLRSAKLVGQP